ncbi:hypothetical protein [Kitasatospora phosalacinea]|uniref:Uncharacterized protein n=1 Tax=Kitasatospora phosalacinea TaxID=2065 RepID=A0ABW6GS99_9ACTN
MALTGAGLLPDDGSNLARQLLDLTGRLQRLEAARRIAAAGLSSGTQADSHGGTPVLTLTSPDLGYGAASVQVRGVSADGRVPASFTATIGSTVFTIGGTGAFLEAWAPLSLANGWTAAGGSWAAPVQRRQADGTVQLAGEITPGTLTAGTTLFTLPYPPGLGDHTFRVPGGAAAAWADLYISKATGAVTIQNTTGTITRLGLSAVRYPL